MNSFVVEREAVKQNAEEIIKRAKDAKVIAVIKGRGYGFGTDDYVKLLHECGISFFAVTDVSDALKIRAMELPDTEILMLCSTSLYDELSLLIENDICITIGSTEAAVEANKIASKLSKRARAHIKINTGMGRYGFLPDDFENIVSAFTKFEFIEPCGLFTHLSSAFCSSKITESQIAALLSVKTALEAEGISCGMLHFANSSYLFKFKEPLGDAVRIGSAFTGRIPVPSKKSGLCRTGHLEGNICEIHWLPPKSPVGYGCAFRTKSATRTAVVALGYCDGFMLEKAHDSYRLRDGLRYALSELRRALSRKRVYVTVNGQKARVLGHVGMTHTVCDVTEIKCNIGDKVCFDANPLCVPSDILREYV